MATRDSSKKPFVEDRDSNVSIGIDLPFRKGLGEDGWFATTKDTISAVKNNIKMLLNTDKGERIMQPNLGSGLNRFLFEQFTDDVRIAMEDEIVTMFRKWLPFVEIRDIRIKVDAGGEATGKNRLNVYIDFNITKNPNTLESVSIEIK